MSKWMTSLGYMNPSLTLSISSVTFLMHDRKSTSKGLLYKGIRSTDKCDEIDYDI